MEWTLRRPRSHVEASYRGSSPGHRHRAGPGRHTVRVRSGSVIVAARNSRSLSVTRVTVHVRRAAPGGSVMIRFEFDVMPAAARRALRKVSLAEIMFAG